MPNTLSGSGSEPPPPASSSSAACGGGESGRGEPRGRLLPFLRRTRRAALRFGGGEPPWAPGSVAALMRSEPLIAPFDPLASVHAALRRSSTGSLCVGAGGQVLGVLRLDALDRVLAANMKYLGGPVEPALSPLTALLEGPEPLLALDPAPLLRRSDPLDRAQAALAAHDESTLAVVVTDDARAAYLGVVYKADVVAASLGNLAPVRVGGMATPLGVYLTDGVVQGGAGNLGLALTGMTMTFLITVARIITFNAFQWLQARYNFSLTRLLAVPFFTINPGDLMSISDDLQIAVAVPLLLVFLRLVPISGFHAAEHQTVHCLERGLPLIPENVRTMPRVHPRCGTNLVAGLSILTLALTIGFGLTGSIAAAVVPAVIVTLLTWRQIGSAVQQFLTTRPASDKQIASGIRAGQEVMRRSLQAGLERRPNAVQRVWNMGLPQLMGGAYLMIALLQLFAYFVPATRRYLTGLN